MITVSGLSKAHGPRTLFTDVTFRLLPGRRIALVGGNGVVIDPWHLRDEIAGLRGQGVAIVLGNRFAARAGAAGPQLCLVQTGPSVAQPALLRLDNNVVENENQRPLALLRNE